MMGQRGKFIDSVCFSGTHTHTSLPGMDDIVEMQFDGRIDDVAPQWDADLDETGWSSDS
jgi:hypothetical protein